MRVERGDILPARAQPLLHHRDLVFLRELDTLRQPLHHIAAALRRKELCHLDRLRMVGDHPLHELHVGVGEPDTGEIGGFLSRDFPAGLAGSAGLHDGSLRLGPRRAECGEPDADHDARGRQRENGFLEAHGIISVDLG